MAAWACFVGVPCAREGEQGSAGLLSTLMLCFSIFKGKGFPRDSLSA